MDSTCKKILKLFHDNPDIYVMYYDNPYEKMNISSDEFFRAVRYLKDQELIEYITNQDGAHIGITASHKQVHRKKIHFDSFIAWFFHSYIGGVITGVTATILAEVILKFL